MDAPGRLNKKMRGAECAPREWKLLNEEEFLHHLFCSSKREDGVLGGRVALDVHDPKVIVLVASVATQMVTGIVVRLRVHADDFVALAVKTEGAEHISTVGVCGVSANQGILLRFGVTVEGAADQSFAVIPQSDEERAVVLIGEPAEAEETVITKGKHVSAHGEFVLVAGTGHESADLRFAVFVPRERLTLAGEVVHLHAIGAELHRFRSILALATPERDFRRVGVVLIAQEPGHILFCHSCIRECRDCNDIAAIVDNQKNAFVFLGESIVIVVNLFLADVFPLLVELLKGVANREVVGRSVLRGSGGCNSKLGHTTTVTVIFALAGQDFDGVLTGIEADHFVGLALVTQEPDIGGRSASFLFGVSEELLGCFAQGIGRGTLESVAAGVNANHSAFIVAAIVFGEKNDPLDDFPQEEALLFLFGSFGLLHALGAIVDDQDAVFGIAAVILTTEGPYARGVGRAGPGFMVATGFAGESGFNFVGVFAGDPNRSFGCVTEGGRLLALDDIVVGDVLHKEEGIVDGLAGSLGGGGGLGQVGIIIPAASAEQADDTQEQEQHVKLLHSKFPPYHFFILLT